MKTLLLISLAMVLSAFDNVTAAKIFDKIFQAMIDKPYISVYTSNETYKKVITRASSLHLYGDCNKVDIILVDSFGEIPKWCEDRLFFTTSYPVFQKFDNAVGAFYWDKGHIVIKFSESRLQKYKITLPDTFNKFLIKEK